MLVGVRGGQGEHSHSDAVTGCRGGGGGGTRCAQSQ